jgi:hypothetical protein
MFESQGNFHGSGKGAELAAKLGTVAHAPGDPTTHEEALFPLGGDHRDRDRNRYRLSQTNTADCDCDCDCHPDSDPDAFGFLFLFSKQ